MKKMIFIIISLLFTFSLSGNEGFNSIFEGSEDSNENPEFPLEISGEVNVALSYFFNDALQSEVSANPEGKIQLKASGKQLEASAIVHFSLEDLTSNLKISDIVEELYIRAYFPFGNFEAGYFKVEWGKGDGDHVIDPLNPIDQSNGFILDLNEMKSAEFMAKLNIYLGTIGLLEFVYKPFFTPLTVATEGRWKSFDLTSLPGYPMITSPDTNTLEYSQAATRASLSLGIVDLGLLYYFGFMTEPAYKITLATEILYTRAHLFGLEAAIALGPFTMRGELGYWLTDDLNGDIAEEYNNRLVYLGGFDFKIPLISLFVSAQYKGAYVLNFKKNASMDVDTMASFKNTAFSNTFIATIELPFYRDLMKLNVSALYQLESRGYMVSPAFYWTIIDDLELKVSAIIFGGDNTGNSPFYSWDENDNISIGLRYYF